MGARTRSDNSAFHPLCLPKTILDATDAQFAGQTPEWGGEFAQDITWGHDGLVSTSSARRGEFPGAIEGVYHWELRGSTGPGPVSAISSSSTGTAPDSENGAGRTGWGKSFTSWQNAREIKKPATLADSGEGKRRAAVAAALDWVVNAVLSEHAANPGDKLDLAESRDERSRAKVY